MGPRVPGSQRQAPAHPPGGMRKRPLPRNCGPRSPRRPPGSRFGTARPSRAVGRPAASLPLPVSLRPVAAFPCFRHPQCASAAQAPRDQPSRAPTSRSLCSGGYRPFRLLPAMGRRIVDPRRSPLRLVDSRRQQPTLSAQGGGNVPVHGMELAPRRHVVRRRVRWRDRSPLQRFAKPVERRVSRSARGGAPPPHLREPPTALGHVADRLVGHR